MWSLEILDFVFAEKGLEVALSWMNEIWNDAHNQGKRELQQEIRNLLGINE
jgi:hypothetical protein